MIMDPITSEQSAACNMPKESGYWSLTIYSTQYENGSNGTVYIARNRDSGNIYRMVSLNNKFSEWVRIATATPPQAHTIQLAEGWRENTPCRYFKTQENVVVVILDAIKADSATGSVSLATLPEGYRPSYPIRTVATTDASGANSANVLISTDGSLRVNLRGAEDIYCITQAVFAVSG